MPRTTLELKVVEDSEEKMLPSIGLLVASALSAARAAVIGAG